MSGPSSHTGGDRLAETSYLTDGPRERPGQGAVASSWPATHAAGIAPSGPVGGDHPSASAAPAPGAQQLIARGQPRGGRGPGGDRRAQRTAGWGARPRPTARCLPQGGLDRYRWQSAERRGPGRAAMASRTLLPKEHVRAAAGTFEQRRARASNGCASGDPTPPTEGLPFIQSRRAPPVTR